VKFRGNILRQVSPPRPQIESVSTGQERKGKGPYKVSQVNMTIAVQKDIVRLDVPMHNPATMDIQYSARQLGHPKPDSILGESLPRDVKS
jgi:hypothetical protein